MTKLVPTNPAQPRRWVWILAASAVLALAALLAFQHNTPPPVETVLRQAEALRGQGQAPEAAKLLTSALSTDPQAQRELRERLGVLYQEAGLAQEAAAHLERAMRLGSDGETIRRLIRARLGSDEDKEALKLIKMMQDTWNDDAEMRQWQRMIQARAEDDKQKAEAAYLELLEATPENREAWRRLVRVEFDLGQWQDASEKLATALERFPDDMVFLRMAGYAAYVRRDFAHSAALLERLVALEHRWFNGAAPHAVDLAKAILYQGDYAKANTLLDDFLLAAPNHADALFFRSLGALRVDDYKTAYAHASQLALQYPAWKDCSLLAGAAALGLGERRTARGYLAIFKDSPSEHPGKRLWLAASQESGQGGQADAEDLHKLFQTVLR